MNKSFRTPVILILFNRPDRIRELLAVLRTIRPAHILAVADGPRLAHPSDVQACRVAREALAAIDWPCTLEREFSDDNLGCDRRIASGLDWAFGRVSEAIVLEDDVLPDPSFLPWAADMLDRYRDDPDLLMLSGHNPLGCWPIEESDSPADHIRIRRGSVWGWATTAAAWRSIWSTNIGGAPENAAGDLAAFGLDPLVVEHYRPGLEAFRSGLNVAFDMLLGIRIAARRGVAGVSPINLVRNTGIGPGATRTTFSGDFSGLVPVGQAVPGTGTPAPPRVDTTFDRAAVLVELMTRCADPPMGYRLSRLTGPRETAIDPAIWHHLAPFRFPNESLRLVEHLAALGVTSPQFEQLRETLTAATRKVSARG